MEKKYHLLYRVKNEQTLKEYIGVHSTDNIEDGYMGSGTLLKKDIKQFGVGAFSREIIDVFENIQNLEINHFFLCNYINNPSLYNAYLANELDERKYNNDRIVWSGCLERWKNRL